MRTVLYSIHVLIIKYLPAAIAASIAELRENRPRLIAESWIIHFTCD